MREESEEKQVFYCVICGHQMGRFKGDSQVELKCPKCKRETEFIYCEGRLHADSWPEGGPGVREPALTT